MLAWSWRSVDTMRAAAVKVMLQLTENLHSPLHGQSSWQSCLSTTRMAFPLRGAGHVPVLSIQHQILCTQHIISFLNPSPAEGAAWGSVRWHSHAWHRRGLPLLYSRYSSSCCLYLLFSLYRLSLLIHPTVP